MYALLGQDRNSEQLTAVQHLKAQVPALDSRPYALNLLCKQTQAAS